MKTRLQHSGHVNHNLGITLIELLITLTLIAIIVVAATPSLTDALQKQRLTAGLDRLTADILLARSESVKSGDHSIICPTSTGTACSKQADWHRGWMVFSDTNKNGEFDRDEPLHRVQNRLHYIRAKAYNQRLQIIFTKTGSTLLSNTTIIFCGTRNVNNALSLLVNSAGQIKVNRDINPQFLSHCQST